jgi:pyruvate/2-oxoglutarate dehydrogenase complex dihydrolipoamide acyltransferase (E2) component
MTDRGAALIPLVVPDLGTGPIPVTVSLWLVPRGASVLAGDRVVELVAGGVTIDLEAPVSGRLVSQLADEDEVVVTSRVLAEFEAAA